MYKIMCVMFIMLPFADYLRDYFINISKRKKSKDGISKKTVSSFKRHDKNMILILIYLILKMRKYS